MRRQRPRLIRQLGLQEATAVALGAMIGAGVYVAIAEAGSTTGGSLLIAVILGATVATLNGLSSAELGVDDPRAGGAYQFGRRLISPAVGFLAGWLFLIGSVSASATFALTFGAYLEPILPGVPTGVTGLVLVVLATALNAAGIRLSARLVAALVVVNLAILAALVAIAAPTVRVANFGPFLPGGLIGLLQAGALMFFAFTGYARPVTIAEEVREPATTIPRAVVGAIGITTVLYLAVATAALGTLGYERLDSAAPLRAVMVAAGSPSGAGLVSVGALVATSGVLLTEIWGLSRLIFAMGRNGDLPEWLGTVVGPNAIPRNAVLIIGVLLVVPVALIDLRPALEASSLALLVYYGVMNLAALQLPRDRRLYPPVVPAAGLAANVLVALSLPAATILAVGALAMAGLAYYGIRARSSRRPSST